MIWMCAETAYRRNTRNKRGHILIDRLCSPGFRLSQVDGGCDSSNIGDINMAITSEDSEPAKQQGFDTGVDLTLDMDGVKVSTEKLVLLAQAYKEGLEAGGQEEAERRMREKFDELNPVNPKESTDEQ